MRTITRMPDDSDKKFLASTGERRSGRKKEAKTKKGRKKMMTREKEKEFILPRSHEK